MVSLPWPAAGRAWRLNHPTNLLCMPHFNFWFRSTRTATAFHILYRQKIFKAINCDQWEQLSVKQNTNYPGSLAHCGVSYSILKCSFLPVSVAHSWSLVPVLIAGEYVVAVVNRSSPNQLTRISRQVEAGSFDGRDRSIELIVKQLTPSRKTSKILPHSRNISFYLRPWELIGSGSKAYKHKKQQQNYRHCLKPSIHGTPELSTIFR